MAKTKTKVGGAEKLSAFLEKNHYTQAGFGALIGASQSSVSKWARDAKAPGKRAREKIARHSTVKEKDWE